MPRGAKKQRWQLVVNSYPCPVCGSGPGYGCRTQTAHRFEPHADRARLAHARGWAAAEDPARCVQCNGPLPGEDPPAGRCRKCTRLMDGSRMPFTAEHPAPDGSYDVPLFGEEP